jgi:hypothetical protein
MQSSVPFRSSIQGVYIRSSFYFLLAIEDLWGCFYLPFELESSLHFKVIKNNAKNFINKYNSLDLAWKTTVIYRGIDI